jgi:aspartate aminotransferase
MNSRLLQVQESTTIRIADMAREIERRGERVIKLQTGDPDFATPEVIIAGAHQAMKTGYTHYVASRGLPALCQALADKLRRDNGLEYDPNTELLVTHGASHAIFVALQALLEPGDEVLVISPFWMPYASLTQLAGGYPIQVPTDPGRGFEFDLDELRARLTRRSRLLILNTPTNPTGKVFSREELRAIAEAAETYDLYVLADEVYEKLIYDGGEHVSFAALDGLKERTITVNSLSKTYAMTGWRVGYLAAPSVLVEQMLKVAQYSGTNVAPFSQMAALVALTDPSLTTFIEQMRQTFDRRRQHVIEALHAIDGLRLAMPQGAFYFMLDISSFCQDSMAFAYRLLDKARVAVVPGVSFGDCAEGWVRITFALDEVALLEGLARMGEFLHTEYAL